MDFRSAVDGAFELIEQFKYLGIVEGQNLCQQDSANVLLWVQPEIRVEQSCPCETSCGATAADRLTVDEEAIKAEAREMMMEYRKEMEATWKAAQKLEPYYREMYLKAAAKDVGMNRWLQKQ